MSSVNSKILIFGTLAVLAAGMYFAATKFATEVEPTDPMSEFKASPSSAGTGQSSIMSEFKTSQMSPPASSGQGSGAEVAPVDVMLVGLKQRLDKQPDDVNGWVLLSKSYYHLQRWQAAQQAFEKAKALGYAGSWQPLPRIDSFSQNAAATQNFSSAIEFRDDRTNQDGNAAIADETPTATGGSLKLRVSLDPALADGIAAASPVFIFVRSVENPGPPLAVVRKTVGDMPFEVALNDGNAMIPGKTISSAANVIVGARVSLSGSPARQPGDYEKLSDSIPSNYAETIELVIKDKI